LCRSGPFCDGRYPRTFGSCHNLPPRDPPLAHFENKEVSTFLHFPVSYFSQGNPDMNRSTTQQPGPWWILPKASIQETTTPELMTARGLGTSQNSKKERSTLPAFPGRTVLIRPQELKNGILPPLVPHMCKHTLVTLINRTCRAIGALRT
jgi:hypothetical protein